MGRDIQIREQSGVARKKVTDDGYKIIEQEKKVSEGDPTMVTSDNSETESVNSGTESVNSETESVNPNNNTIIKLKEVKLETGSHSTEKKSKLDEYQNDYHPKCIFVLLKVIFLLAILVVLVFFHLKNKQILDDETSSWCIFSSLIITTLFKMIIDCFTTEIRDKIWSILVNSSLLLGLFLLVLMYMSHWPFSTYGIYLPFFMVPIFLPFHDISAIPSYIKELPKIAGLYGAECHLLFVFIYNMALMIVVLLTASKLEGEFNAPWWTILTVFSVAYSLYLMWLGYALYEHNNNKVSSHNNLSYPPLHARVHIILDILSQFILIISLPLISLMIE
jgi:cation transport ATPase